jgi:phosphatidylserine decarboxylase
MKTNENLPVAKEGLPFIIPLALGAIGVAWLKWHYLSWGLLLLTIFSVYFFRNPKREIPPSDEVILSPADGRVIQVEKHAPNQFMPAETTKISIFMSLFNVHINRSPISGVIEGKAYRRGRFFMANADRSSAENEQNAMVIGGKNGLRILFVQIAGFIARRIVCYAEKGDHLEKGQIYGMIRFGSRLDVYLPDGTKAVVKVGDRVRGGESILGVIQ